MPSITTMRGDQGETDLLYGIRVPKSHPRIGALGSVDELMAALGLVRSHPLTEGSGELLREVQVQLIGLMGELATAPRDGERYAKDGFQRLQAPATEKISAAAQVLESQLPPFKDWVIPGDHGPAAAALDFARAVCRRAERDILSLPTEWTLPNPEVVRFLNRLSDWLWLLARTAGRD